MYLLSPPFITQEVNHIRHDTIPHYPATQRLRVVATFKSSNLLMQKLQLVTNNANIKTV